MSLMIKGVDMPEKCEDCPCYDYIDYVCRGDDCFAPFDVENPEKRSEHCPLIEISAPHGRLIDADELLLRIQNSGNYLSPAILAFIETAETIIDKEE